MWLLLSCFVDAHSCARLLSGTGAERVGREAFLRLELGFGSGMLFYSQLSTIRQSVFMP